MQQICSDGFHKIILLPAGHHFNTKSMHAQYNSLQNELRF